tara:strand:- start:630 stop:785 length:156 start_codon:yes stop_codon:yes gene_type:complete
MSKVNTKKKKPILAHCLRCGWYIGRKILSRDSNECPICEEEIEENFKWMEG